MAHNLQSESDKDMIVGVKAIADLIGKTERQTNYMLRNKQLPAFKWSKLWHMRPSTYIADVRRREAVALTITQAKTDSAPDLAA